MGDAGVAARTRPPVLFNGWVVSGWLLAAVTASLVIAGVWVTVADGSAATQVARGAVGISSVIATGMVVLGAFVNTRWPRHRLAWVLLVVGASRGLLVLADAWSQRTYTIDGGSGASTFGPLASWLQSWLPFVAIALMPAMVGLFPDGRTPEGRFRFTLWFSAAAAAVATIAVPVLTWRYRGPVLAGDGVPDELVAHAALGAIAIVVVLATCGIGVGVVALVVRWRRARGIERRQFQWFTYGVVVTFVVNGVGDLGPRLAPLRLVGVVIFFACLGAAIFRYRLYDVDRLINRTLVYGVVSVVVLFVFLAIVITLGAALNGRSTGVIAASAFVAALLLRPAHTAIQEHIDRRFDRRRYGAVQAMRTLSARVDTDPVAPDQLSTRVGAALGDPSARLLFRSGTGELLDGTGTPTLLRPSTPGEAITSIRVSGAEIAVLVHRTAPEDAWLLDNVIAAARGAIGHARSQSELVNRLAEVTASRTRIVAAADTERQRIERDLHDGAQQRMLAVAFQLESTRRSIEPADTTLRATLAAAVQDLQTALEDLRRLTSGLLPATLERDGLRSALEDLALASGCDFDLHGAEDRRLDPLVEATAWFVASEGLANVAKHAPGAPAKLTLGLDNSILTVDVTDAGPGIADPGGSGLRGLADRVVAVGGRLDVTTGPTGGTTLRAHIPCES